MIAGNSFIKDLFNCLAGTSNLIAAGQNQNAIVLPLGLDEVASKNKERQLLVAFSGGPDSTALLLALQAIAPSFNFALQACHINHGLRRQEADADAAFCEKICRELGITCKVIKLPLNPTGAHLSEDSLRQMRYQHLIDVAREKNIAFIITGHTLDDQAETILFRLFRGTALTGLTGMKACRQLSDEIYLLRPLLNVTKEQCRQFLQNKSIEACHDSSNLDEIYSRNYMRHKIMPAINKRFPDFTQHLHSMRQILASEDELLAKLAQQLFNQLESIDTNSWSLSFLTSEPLALQRRAVAYALQKRNIDLSFVRIEEILTLSESDKALNLNEHWRVRISQDKLHWQRIRPANNNEIDNFVPITVKVPGMNPVLPLGMALSVETYRGGLPEIGQALVDLSNIKPPLTLRLRQPGDIIRPLGMGQSIKLKKYLHTHKKTEVANSPDSIEVLLADQEEVLWLPGRGLSEKIKVTESPSHSLQWLKLPDSSSTIF